MSFEHHLTLAVAVALAATALAAPTAAATFPGANGRIAFVRDTDIHTMTSEGRDVRRLTATGRNADAFFQSWSADGTQIVFTRFVRGRRGELWTMGADGSGKRLLLRTPGRENVAPRFSPDGATVIFGRCGPDGCALWRVNADGTQPTPLTPFGGAFDMHPSFSPAGDAIAFWSENRRGVRPQAVYVGAPDVSGLRRLTPPRLEACCPDWAPDGSRLAFHSHGCDPDCPRLAEIWTVGIDGSGLTRLTNTGRQHDFDPSWSPDGTAIAFERRSPNSRRQSVYVVDADGGRARLLQRRAQHPRWGPAPA
jgi:Tol biopolymer transport system component